MLPGLISGLNMDQDGLMELNMVRYNIDLSGLSPLIYVSVLFKSAVYKGFYIISHLWTETAKWFQLQQYDVKHPFFFFNLIVVMIEKYICNW